jgi:hypothetical protein
MSRLAERHDYMKTNNKHPATENTNAGGSGIDLRASVVECDCGFRTMILHRQESVGITPTGIRKLRKIARENRYHFTMGGLSKCPRCDRPIILSGNKSLVINSGQVIKNTTGRDVKIIQNAQTTD